MNYTFSVYLYANVQKHDIKIHENALFTQSTKNLLDESLVAITEFMVHLRPTIFNKYINIHKQFGCESVIYNLIFLLIFYKRFVKYFSEGDADKAVSEIDGKEVDGKTISVKRDFKQ